jgi:hypothetical protein
MGRGTRACVAVGRLIRKPGFVRLVPAGIASRVRAALLLLSSRVAN